jgi:energy-converting hydrogenase Eha subunit G
MTSLLKRKGCGVNNTVYRFLAIVVANGSAALVVRIVERRYPELRGALNGLYLTVMVAGFSCFFHDMPALWVAPMFLLSSATLIRLVRKRLLAANAVDITK